MPRHPNKQTPELANDYKTIVYTKTYDGKAAMLERRSQWLRERPLWCVWMNR